MAKNTIKRQYEISERERKRREDQRNLAKSRQDRDIAIESIRLSIGANKSLKLSMTEARMLYDRLKDFFNPSDYSDYSDYTIIPDSTLYTSDRTSAVDTFKHNGGTTMTWQPANDAK